MHNYNLTDHECRKDLTKREHLDKQVTETKYTNKNLTDNELRTKKIGVYLHELK